MKKFTGHREAWGDFVDVKINAPDCLRADIRKKEKDTVWMSGVCDPYQPLEEKYRLTRACLEILAENGWPAAIQTRSPLVTRDMDIINRMAGTEAGFSVPTADDSVRMIFEPLAPSIERRISALDELHRCGIRTYAMIAPLLPGAEELPALLAGKVDHIIVDRLNYNYADALFRENNLGDFLKDAFFSAAARSIAADCARLKIPCRTVFNPL
jgi:DNA repair photolyase